jgi:hypothetical protein
LTTRLCRCGLTCPNHIEAQGVFCYREQTGPSNQVSETQFIAPESSSWGNTVLLHGSCKLYQQGCTKWAWHGSNGDAEGRKCPHLLASAHFVRRREYSCLGAYLRTTPWRHGGGGSVPPYILILGTRWSCVVSLTPRRSSPRNSPPPRIHWEGDRAVWKGTLHRCRIAGLLHSMTILQSGSRQPPEHTTWECDTGLGGRAALHAPP